MIFKDRERVTFFDIYQHEKESNKVMICIMINLHELNRNILLNEKLSGHDHLY